MIYWLPTLFGYRLHFYRYVGINRLRKHFRSTPRYMARSFSVVFNVKSPTYFDWTFKRFVWHDVDHFTHKQPVRRVHSALVWREQNNRLGSVYRFPVNYPTTHGASRPRSGRLRGAVVIRFFFFQPKFSFSFTWTLLRLTRSPVHRWRVADRVRCAHPVRRLRRDTETSRNGPTHTHACETERRTDTYAERFGRVSTDARTTGTVA